MPLEGPPNQWMDFRGIKYAIVEGSPEGTYAYDQGQVPMNIHVAWEQIYGHTVPGMIIGFNDAVTLFTGDVNVITTGLGGKLLQRINPHPFPPRPWMYALRCNHIKPMGMRGIEENPIPGLDPIAFSRGYGNQLDGTMIPKYMMAEMGLVYSMPHYKIKDDTDPLVLNPNEGPFQMYPDEGWALEQGYKTNSRYITREIKRQNKMLTIPRGLLRDEDNKPIMEAIAITENTAIYEYTWWHVPDEGLPEQTWISAANTVNDATFDGRPPGTLLFCGEPETRSQPNPITGKRLNTVKYTFHSLIMIEEAEIIPPEVDVIRGHNYIRKVIAGKLKPVKFSTDGAGTAKNTTIFRPFDFKKLFRPDQS